MLLAFGIGALGTVVGSAIAGVDMSWNAALSDLLYIVLANVLGLMVGFMLSVLIRSSAGAIVAYFVYSFVLPTIFGLLAGFHAWFEKLQPWVDFTYAQKTPFNGSLSGEQWAHLGVTGVLWLLLPLTVGVAMVLRSEMK
ncbi:MAG: hypothetical protein ACR2FG_01655 [Marmoricola sp.]